MRSTFCVLGLSVFTAGMYLPPSMADDLISCPTALTIPLNDIHQTQHGRRMSQADRERLRLSYESHGGRFQNRMVVNQFEDGSFYLRDGHHRFDTAKDAGKTELRAPEDVRLERYSYAEYEDIDFSKGWITPFDPRKDLRLAQLTGYRRLIRALLAATSEDKVREFIRAHPEAYSIEREAASAHAQQVVDSFEGSLRDREAYFRRMDLSMPIKIAQLLPVIPSRGILYEPGTGSGSQAAAYAAYHPELLVVASDLDIKSVRHAQSRFQLPNLVYLRAGAAESVFPDNFFDAVVDSSLGHHLTSYGPPAFTESNIDGYRREVVRITKPGGHYGMRDSGVAGWPSRVVVKLPTHPQAGKPPYGNLPLPVLFADFARKFRSHDYLQPFEWKVVKREDGFEYIEAPGEAVQNFLLRVRYMDSWDSEIKEQYTYYSGDEHISSLKWAGWTSDFAGEVRNPFILRNWWESQGIAVFDLGAKRLEEPPTNFLLYATKPAPWQTRDLKLTRTATREAKWLELKGLRDRTDGKVWDLIDVPGVTRAYVPIEHGKENLFFYLLPNKDAYGILLYQQESPLARARYGGTLAGLLTEVSDGSTSTVEGFRATLRKKAHAVFDSTSEEFATFTEFDPFFPSPGGSNEIVYPQVIDLKGRGDSDVFKSGDAKRFELNQLLAAAHVGSIPDPTLEAVAYALALQHHYSILAWTGVAPPTTMQSLGKLPSERQYSEKLISVKTPRYEEVDEAPGFMKVVQVEIERENGDGQRSKTVEEYSLPAHRLPETVTVVPYINSKGTVYVGLEQRAFAALETRGYDPQLAVIPAWRLGKTSESWVEGYAELFRRMKDDFDLNFLSITSLGEGTFPSVHNAVERATPIAVEVDAAHPPRGLTFVPLKTLVKQAEKIPELHTRIGVYRLAHALGMFEYQSP